MTADPTKNPAVRRHMARVAAAGPLTVTLTMREACALHLAAADVERLVPGGLGPSLPRAILALETALEARGAKLDENGWRS